MEAVLEAAQKLVGSEGKVYFARKEGEYKGEILDVGPVYISQRVGSKTVFLHRLKDFEKKDMLEKGATVVIRREAGRSVASANLAGPETGKGPEMER
jgi:hypothetical protein